MATINRPGTVPGSEPFSSHRRSIEPKHLVLPSVAHDTAVISDAAQVAARAALHAANSETFEPNPLVLPSVQSQSQGHSNIARIAVKAALKAVLDRLSRMS